MGAFMIFDIEFETEEDKLKFEEKYKIKKKDILVSRNSKCFGVAWTCLRDIDLNSIYFMGFMGYGDPEIILKECLNGKDFTYENKAIWKDSSFGIIRIKFLSWIPINDKNSNWKKIRGRW